MLDQVLGQRAVAREGGDADAAGDEEFLGAQHDGLRDGIHDALHDVRRERLVVVLGQDHDEFVAGQAGDGIRVAQRRAQARRDRHQEHVAGLVAHAVVDVLEAVQVDQHHPDLVAAAGGVGDGLAQAVLQQRAVGQARQHVVLGHVVHALLGDLARRDVAAGAAVAGEAAGLVERGLAVDAEPALLAIVVDDAVFEVAEGFVRFQGGDVVAAQFRVRQRGYVIPAAAAQHAPGGDAGFFREVAGDVGKTEFLVLFPVPVGRHGDELAEALLAFLQGLLGALAREDVVDQALVRQFQVGGALAHQFLHLARALAGRLHEGAQEQGRQHAANQQQGRAEMVGQPRARRGDGFHGP